ncbi:MAG TPA: chemotaxis protein CheA [Candidatus Wunengus sp. YC60]|uniref:chemotaxis protein CheA n=1 Tax=Candidatus Wunengus sp. YC60 TaxID=3367697 RepID=UPI004025F4C7
MSFKTQPNLIVTMAEKDTIDFLRFLGDYLTDARDGFQIANKALLALEKDFSRTELLDEIFRVFHTMKSSSIMLAFSDIADLAHLTEDLLDLMRKNTIQVSQKSIDIIFELADTLELMVKERAVKKGASGSDWSAKVSEFRTKIEELKGKTLPETAQMSKNAVGGGNKGEDRKAGIPTIEKIQTVRVHIDLLDSLFNTVGEIIILRNRIENIASKMQDKELKSTLAEMNRLITELQDNVSVARMVPVTEIFDKFPRMVRDLAKERRKEIDFVLEGSEIELDKAIIDAISEPVLHLLRNAIDHGIESPEERQKQNKSMRGRVRLAAKRTENHILIEVEDDGRGIDTSHIKRVAVRKGFIKQEEADSLQDKNIMNLLFHPSFTTAEEVTGISGRGVGLYVVKTSAKELGGSVEMITQIGKGTRFTLKLPLSTAIMQMLMVGVGEHVFGIPSDIVIETLDVKPSDVREMQENKVIVLRKEVITFVPLHEVLNIPYRQGSENLIAVIINRGNKFMAIGVTTVLDQIENIVKPFDPIARQFKGFSGGMVLGDGRVALLLDIPALLNFETLKEEKYLA